MFSENNKIEDYILKRLSNYKISICCDKADMEIQIADQNLYNILSFLQHDTHCQFEQLLDLIVLDCPDQDKRFDLIYIVGSLKNNKRLQIGTSISGEIDSVTEIYRNACWLEREAWEMFGVFFKNNRDVRRLLTQPSFVGYPLRKDYPATGFTEYVFDETTHKFSSIPLSLLQEYRVFDVASPWQHPVRIKKKEKIYVEKEKIDAPAFSEELMNEP
jgi:NADH-quinone oxidoreductase subunit C